MKFLKTRQEICEAINLKNYPVLTMDINNAYKIGDKVVGFIGCKVRCNSHVYKNITLYDNCELTWFDDTKIFNLSGGSITLSARFSYRDLMKDVEYANAPIVNNGEAVIVITDNKNEEIKIVLLIDLNKKEQINLFDYI